MKKNNYINIVFVPLISLFILVSIYLISINFLGLTSKTQYIPHIESIEEIESGIVVDQKKKDNDIYILKKNEINIYSTYPKINKEHSIIFNKFNININPTAFGIDSIGNIYVVSNYKYIYIFKYNNGQYQLKREKYYPQGNKRYNPNIISDGAGNTGHYCIDTHFKHIIDIDSSEVIVHNQDFIVPELLILDSGYNKVLRCNGGFGPSYVNTKHIEYSIKNPNFLFSPNPSDYYIYKNDGYYEYIGLNNNNKYEKIGRTKNRYRIDNMDQSLDTSYYNFGDRGNNGNLHDIKEIEKEYGDEVKGLIRINDNNNEKNSFVFFNNKDGLYLINYTIEIYNNILYYIKKILLFLPLLLLLYLPIIFYFLYNYSITNKIKYAGSKNFIITTLYIAIITFIILIVGCEGVSGEGGIACFLILLGGLFVGFINFIINIILGIIISKKIKNNK